jgi:hypothetical protein
MFTGFEELKHDVQSPHRLKWGSRVLAFFPRLCQWEADSSPLYSRPGLLFRSSQIPTFDPKQEARYLDATIMGQWFAMAATQSHICWVLAATDKGAVSLRIWRALVDGRAARAWLH